MRRAFPINAERWCCDGRVLYDSVAMYMNGALLREVTPEATWRPQVVSLEDVIGFGPSVGIDMKDLAPFISTDNEFMGMRGTITAMRFESDCSKSASPGKMRKL